MHTCINTKLWKPVDKEVVIENYTLNNEITSLSHFKRFEGDILKVREFVWFKSLFNYSLIIPRNATNYNDLRIRHKKKNYLEIILLLTLKKII